MADKLPGAPCALRMATMFSGIGAPEVAAASIPGVRSTWCAEIDPFACKVLAYRHPNIPNLGDVTSEDFIAKAKEASRSGGATRLDVLCAGAPCQDFSIAGQRAGMDGARGGLSKRFIDIVGELRPRWLLFENVPGLFSSNRGEDFKAFLEALTNVGYHLSWTVLDAQYFEVAQRRERVFVVGYLGDWRPPFAVLFDIESLQGNPAPRRQTREEVAGTLGGGTGERGWCPDTDRMTFVAPATAFALNAKGGSGRIDGESETFIGASAPIGTRPYADNASHESRLITHSLRGVEADASEDGTGRGTPIVAQAPPGRRVAGFCNSAGDTNLGYGEELAPPITRRNGDPGNILAFDTTQITSKTNRSNPQPGDACHPLASGAHVPVVLPDISPPLMSGSTSPKAHNKKNGTDREAFIATASTLKSNSGRNQIESDYVPIQSGVRRLTVIECARLQGFPDAYLHIPTKPRKVTSEMATYLAARDFNITTHPKSGGALAPVPADGPMYRALGNSMAVPVMRWLLSRIAAVNALNSGGA